MNKKDLIDAIAKGGSGTVYPKKVAEDILERLAVVADEQLQSGGELNIPGIGKLSVKQRAARIGRNPRTGEQVQVEASKGVKFTASSTLKKAVAA